MTIFEKWQLGTSALTLLVFTVGLLFAGWQLLLLAKSQKYTYEWNRKLAAQQAIYTLWQAVPIADTRKLNEAFDFVNVKGSIPLQTVLESFEENPELQLTLNKMLNFYETFAVAVLQEIYDDAFMKAAFGSNMAKILEVFKPYIDHRRLTYIPDSYQEMEKLVKQWNL